MIFQDQLAVEIEAILLTTDVPLTSAKIAQVAAAASQSEVTKAIAELNDRYDEIGASFQIKAIAGGYQIQTRPEYDHVVSRLHEDRREQKLSQAALETLAIVAYRQPILRADIEAIRGVACGEVLRTLMDKQLGKIVGRADVLGRPLLYGTTRKFLEVFGLSRLEDLPNIEELRSGASRPAPTLHGMAADDELPADATAPADQPDEDERSDDQSDDQRDNEADDAPNDQ